jgi:predicted HAD superfamily Cof-like phosphohydrolase
MRSKHQRRIEDFMLLAGQEVKYFPRIPTDEIRKLRATLIFEEARETLDALGFGVEITGPHPKDFNLIGGETCNIIEVADGCADISVVTIGTLSAFGISDKPLLKEVDESNLRKFGPGGYRREDGKWIKPPDWKSPDIEGVLVKQGYPKIGV